MNFILFVTAKVIILYLLYNQGSVNRLRVSHHQLQNTLYTEKPEGGDAVLSLYFNLARPLLDTNIIQLGIVSWHPSGVRFAPNAGVRGLRCLLYYSVSIPLSLPSFRCFSPSFPFHHPLPFSSLLFQPSTSHSVSRFIPSSRRPTTPLHNPRKIIKYCPMKYLDIYR